jgi:hypothetical protein
MKRSDSSARLTVPVGRRGWPWLAVALAAACYHPSYRVTRAVWAPGGGESPAFVQAQLDSISVADPERDARAFLVRGDSGIMAIYGRVPMTPGFTGDYEGLARRHGVHFLEPQCAVIYGDAQQDFCRLAMVYAERYNKIVLAALAGENR